MNRVAYSVIDGEDFIVTTSYNDGVAPIRGRSPMRTFGAALLEAYKRGELATASDIRTDPRFTDAERANLLTHGIVAFIRVMLRKEGQLVATFGVNSLTPRDWTRDEIALIEGTAERMWSAAERARAETALRESEERLRLVLGASAAGSWTRDPNANHVDWDQAFRRLYGFAPDEPASLDRWLDRIHKDDRPALLELLDEAAHPTRDEWDITFRIVRPDGTVPWIQSMGRVERDRAGAITRLAGLELDVTARRHAEEMLQAQRDEEHNRELRLLLETAEQGIVSVDARGLIVTANRALETMFGWQPRGTDRTVHRAAGPGARSGRPSTAPVLVYHGAPPAADGRRSRSRWSTQKRINLSHRSQLESCQHIGRRASDCVRHRRHRTPPGRVGAAGANG